MAVREGALDEMDPTCWCCGQTFTESRLVRLGTHPEVAVCLRCARSLNRQARASQERLSPPPATIAARVVADVLAAPVAVLDRARDVVVRRGWARLPGVGPPLRWLGDHLP
jgi:hypothetical protein